MGRNSRLFPLLLLIFCAAAHAQTDTAGIKTADMALLPYGFTDKAYEQQKLAASSPLDQTNPAKLAFVLLIKMYQVVFSSQDGSSCQFRPSCSHYGAEAIKKYGPLQGVLMTGDRLLRCNPYTEDRYKTAPDHYHSADPVEDHVLWGGKKD